MCVYIVKSELFVYKTNSFLQKTYLLRNIFCRISIFSCIYLLLYFARYILTKLFDT